VGLALLAGTFGCSASTAQSDVFVGAGPTEGSTALTALHRRLAERPAQPVPELVVGVGRTGLVGSALDGSSKWSFPGEIRVAPALAGEVVVTADRQHVIALEARSGQLLWRLPLEGRELIGAGDDGSATLVVLAPTRGTTRSLVAVERSGSVRYTLRSTQRVGTPAVWHGIAFVPWDEHNVSALDLSTGAELGRARFGPPVSRAIRLDDQIYFGSDTLLLLDQRVERGALALSLPNRPLPLDPPFHAGGYSVARVRDSAAAARRIHARPLVNEGGLTLADDTYIAAYAGILLGISGQSGELKWTQTFDEAIVGGGALNPGFALCTANGSVVFVSSRGGLAESSFVLDDSLQGCVVQSARQEVPALTQRRPVVEQIALAVAHPDPALEPVQGFLLDELARSADPRVTKVLIDVASNGRTPPGSRSRASKLLGLQRTGVEYMLEALERHYDFLSDVLRPPPVGPLADALSALREPRAAPLLAAHLNDPANSPEDVESAARALSQLATPNEAEDLKTFFALYRATAEQASLVSAIVYVAEALLRVGGRDASDILERAARDPLTHPTVRQKLDQLIPRFRDPERLTSRRP
jgi:outer membrane protein assembly factor BamB